VIWWQRDRLETNSGNGEAVGFVRLGQGFWRCPFHALRTSGPLGPDQGPVREDVDSNSKCIMATLRSPLTMIPEQSSLQASLE
jgi:hypothetical protein